MAEPFVWDGMAYKELYEGPLRGETPVDLPSFSAYGWNDQPRGGAVSCPHRDTFEEAVAEIERMRVEEPYEHWCVTRIETFARMTPMEISVTEPL